MNLIYATNTGTQTVATGSSIQLNAITNRYGNMSVQNGGIATYSKGWYKAHGTITFQSGAGLAQVTAYANGSPVVGAVTALTAEATTTYTLPIDFVFRKQDCNCITDIITLVNTGATSLTVSNVALTVEM